MQTPTGSRIPDPIAEGLASGWQVRGGGHGAPPERLVCDVAIVGTGAGAGITAEVLVQAGLRVLLVEEGPLRSSRDFRQQEREAYPQLYQDSAGRKTVDQAIHILQGRCVGGSTTVNWTSSFRTPERTLRHWVQAHGLEVADPARMAPWFEQVEQRLSIGAWPVAPNRNNALLAEGALRLNTPFHAIDRNVKGCWNLGSCGLGCPTNAKQSMLVTTLPVALDAGAVLLVQHRVERVLHDGRRATGLRARPVALNGDPAPGPIVDIEAQHVVVAGGAINSPALLLRSQVPDPHDRLGRRTFLHPVVISAARHVQPVEGWAGAPQTVYSDHHQDNVPLDGPIGFKLEAAPLHPVIFSTTLAGFGADQADRLRAFPNTHALLALMRDGFHPDSPGGRVRIDRQGRSELDYPLTPYLREGMKRALLTMAELQFAAGAAAVIPVHEGAGPYATWPEARTALQSLDVEPLVTRVVSAHVMGGCAMSAKPDDGVVDPSGRHWQIEGLSVHDGSVFPTSIGANPQVSVYAQAARMAVGLAERLTGRPFAPGGVWRSV